MSELDTKRLVPESSFGHSSRCANEQIQPVTGLLRFHYITIACSGIFRAPVVGLASRGQVHLTENIATEGPVQELHRAQGLDKVQLAKVPAYIAARLGNPTPSPTRIRGYAKRDCYGVTVSTTSSIERRGVVGRAVVVLLGGGVDADRVGGAAASRGRDAWPVTASDRRSNDGCLSRARQRARCPVLLQGRVNALASGKAHRRGSWRHPSPCLQQTAECTARHLIQKTCNGLSSLGRRHPRCQPLCCHPLY